MYPILGRYGPFFLYTLTVVWGMGIFLSLLWVWWHYERAKVFLDLLLVMGMAGIIGGRLGFVWLNWDYFQANTGTWWQWQQGGFTYHGLVLVGGLAGWVWFRYKQYPSTWGDEMAGMSLFLLPFWHGVGWLACYLEGCGYGLPSAPAWFVSDLPDTFGVYDLRVNTQIMGMAWAIIVGGIIVLFKQYPISRWCLFWGMWLLLSVGYAGISHWRADTAIMWGGWRLDTILWLTLTFLSLIGVWHSPKSE